jgi:[ribosomal protein S5]-alanine N-acetyltransferase
MDERTQRVRVREHVIADLEPFCELQMDLDVARYVLWLPRTRSQAESALREAIAQQSVEDRFRFFFAVELQSSREMIGSIGFTKIGSHTADCGWFLRRRFWGKGYASEAVRNMISSALCSGGVSILTASSLRENHGSIRVAETCGFRRLRESEDRVYFEMRR